MSPLVGMRPFAAIVLLVLIGCGGSPSAPSSTPSPGTPGKRLLYVTTSAGFRHDVLPFSQQVLRDVGLRSGFETVATEDVAMITRDNLARFDAVAFFTSGELPIRKRHCWISSAAAKASSVFTARPTPSTAGPITG
jgi:hypothetical protein